jgi:YfiH family protein
LFTTRVWELGSAGADSRQRGWDEVAHAIGVPGPSLVRVHQVHGTTVFVAGNGASPGDADIVIARTPGAALAVQTADCVPLLVADRATGAVAAVHAGWRGLAAGAPRTAVDALRTNFGSRPADLVAAIGPAIGACCYQVGPDVRAAFAGGGTSMADLDRWFSEMPCRLPHNPPMPSLDGERRRRDRWFFDGWEAARRQLEDSGVPREHVFVARLCTASHPGVFCSYRRDGSPAGRLAAAVRGRGPGGPGAETRDEESANRE